MRPTQYQCLEKDVAAVKNDISALTDQITDVINPLPAPPASRRDAATTRPAPMPKPAMTTGPNAAAR